MTIREITNQNERHARATWSIMTEPADSAAGLLTDTFGHQEALAIALEADLADLADLSPELPEQAKTWRARLQTTNIDTVLANADRTGALMIDPATVNGIPDLAEHAPHTLWVHGDTDALNTHPRIGIIGSRVPTEYGRTITSELVTDLTSADTAIHSGGAFGIDHQAHQTALHTGTPTIAWLASGPDRPYPTAHTELFNQIANTPRCAIVTELPPGSTPTKWRFIARMRLIAAASQALIVTEAGPRSGALTAIPRAITLGRPIGAVPGPVTSTSSAGCHRIIREFDATLITHSSQALELLTA